MFYFWNRFLVIMTGWLSNIGAKKFLNAAWEGRTLSPLCIVSIHLYSTTTNCLFFGVIIAWASVYFGSDIRWLYYVSGGLVAFWGLIKTDSWLAMTESLVIYIVSAYLFATNPEWLQPFAMYLLWVYVPIAIIVEVIFYISMWKKIKREAAP